MRNPPPAHLPTRLQYDTLLLLVEIASLLGKDSVPLELGSFVIDLLLPGTLAGKIGALSRHGWMSLDRTQENYRVHEDAIPGTGTGLDGPSFQNVPDEAAANLVAHWKNDVRRFRAEHLLDPPDKPASRRDHRPAKTHSPVPSVPEPPPELVPATPQETTMSDSQTDTTITEDPATWPKRALDDGGNYSVGPRERTFEIDETDWTIMRLCYGRPDLPALKPDIARLRRLTVMQVAGMEATLTRQARLKANEAPVVEVASTPGARIELPEAASEPTPVPEPTSPPVETIASPVPGPRLRTKEEIVELIAWYDDEIAQLSRRRDHLRHLHDNYDPIVAALTLENP